MSYSSNKLSLVTGQIGGASARQWDYFIADSLATILGAGYVTDAKQKGMRVGDYIRVFIGTLNTTGPDATPSTAARGTVSEFASAPRVLWLMASAFTLNAATLVATDPPVVNNATTTSAAGAATLNAKSGTVTTETITTTGQAVYTLTLTNSQVTVGDLVLGTLENGSNTTGIAVLNSLSAGAGVLTAKISNAATTGTNPFGGSLKLKFANLS